MEQFNSYIDNIDTDFWRDLCLNRGELRHYDKDEEFLAAGTIVHYIGYIKFGALKYVLFVERHSYSKSPRACVIMN